MDTNEDKVERMLRDVATRDAEHARALRQRAEQELMAAREALRESSERINDILESITDGFVAVDREWRLVYLNARSRELLRPVESARGTLLGTVFWTAFPELVGTVAEEKCRRAMEEQATSRAEFYHAPLERWLDIRAYPTRTGLSIDFNDITERRRAEEALRSSQSRLQLAMEAGHMGDWQWTLATGEVRWSSTLERIHGLAPGTFGGTFEDFKRDIHPADRDRVLDEVQQSVARSRPYRAEYRIIKPDGSIGWIEARGQLLLDADGNPERMTGICMDATARKQVEVALRESEAFTRTIVDSSRDCIKTLSLDGQLLWISEKGVEALCIPDRNDAIGKHWPDFWQGHDREAAIAAVRAAARGETGTFVGCLSVRGEARWFDVVVSPIVDDAARPEKLLAVSRDVTDRRRVETERAWLSDVLERSLNEIYVFDTVTLRFHYVNDGALRNLGYSLDEMRRMTPLDLKPEFTEASFRAMVAPLLDGRESKHAFETVHKRADGTLYPVEVHLQRVFSGACPLFVAVILDITARLRAEQAQRASDEQLREVVDSIAQLAWIAHPDGDIVWYNRRWYEYTGTTFESMKGWGWQSVHDPSALPKVLERWRACLASGDPFEMEFPLRGADGMYRWFLTRVNPVRGADGRVVRWFGTNTDVDDVKRTREALEDETRILELLNQTGQILASNLDLETLVQTVTDAATQLSGAEFGAFFYNITDEKGDAYLLYTLAGAPREAFEQLGHPRATPIFAPTFRGEGIIRCDDVTKDPRYGTMEPHRGMPAGHLPVRSYLAVPVVSPSGIVIGGLFFGHSRVGIFTERTERIIAGVAAQAAVVMDNARLYEAAQKSADERKVLLDSERAARSHAERMSAIKDEFLATLSHELRTPLSAILGWSQVLQRASRTEDDLRKGLEAVERNARVQTQLIDDLLDMSRITSGKIRLDIEEVEPGSFIEAAIETVRPAASVKGIRIEKLIDPAAAPLRGDPARLQQVVWNLLTNAIKFTPRDGKVQVMVRRVDSHIEITVADTGAGIKPDVLPHIFERFRQGDASTTRRFGGLGLGLAIVKHLVEMHGGSIGVASAGEGQGATFTVRLPLAVARRAAYLEDRPDPGIPKAQPVQFKAIDLSDVKVLIVDDEPDARNLLERLLAECSATVITATAADEAVALVEREKPDVLVSDIGMPDVDGFELLKRVRALGPGRGGRVPAIALTAFARSEDRTRALHAGFLVHVSKPVEPSELIATAASVTGRTG